MKLSLADTSVMYFVLIRTVYLLGLVLSAIAGFYFRITTKNLLRKRKNLCERSDQHSTSVSYYATQAYSCKSNSTYTQPPHSVKNPPFSNKRMGCHHHTPATAAPGKRCTHFRRGSVGIGASLLIYLCTYLFMVNERLCQCVCTCDW